MQKMNIIFLAVGTLSFINLANADCTSSTPACGSKAAYSNWADRYIANTKEAAQNKISEINASGTCRAKYSGNHADNQFEVDFCSITNQKTSAQAKADAANPLANLDCKAMKASGKLASDVVPDPAYYYDAMKGVRATWARLNEFLTNAPSAVSYSQSDALKGLALMKGWLAPTGRQYSQVDDILGGLNACFSKDCKSPSTSDLDPRKTLAKVKEAMLDMQGIEKDMKDKLATMRACDPVFQIAKLQNAINKQQGQLAKNQAVIDSLTKSVTTQCETSTTSTAPMDINQMGLINPSAIFSQPKSVVVVPIPASNQAPAAVTAPEPAERVPATNSRDVDFNYEKTK
jgi:hypothetical protein